MGLILSGVMLFAGMALGVVFTLGLLLSGSGGLVALGGG